MDRRFYFGWLLVSCVALTQAAIGQTTITIDRSDYADQMRGFWLGQTLANWTGLTTEGARLGTNLNSYPFFTDADWGQTITKQISGGTSTIDWVVQDPWRADDDTDIEYVYTDLLANSSQTLLSATDIRDGWVNHINRRIWVSNAQARDLMDRGVLPGATSLPMANTFGHRIDAQLTTEIFGALAPAMPGTALRMGDLPIRTTAHGYAAHASQYFQLLHSYVPLLPDGQTAEQQVQWLSQQARQYIPDSSKTADIIDFVTNDFMNNPDKTDWERTRDLVYARYQKDPAANGFRYQGWTESSVNFASGVIALLYGQGDFANTVKIGTLTGWDSDNPTATMAGLIGMMVGEQGVRDALPGETLSDRYVWSTSRDGLTDHLPGDPNAEDTFDLIAQRMLAIIDRVVAENGGVTDLTGDQWIITLADTADPLSLSPTQQIMARSANMTMKLAGQTVTATSSVTSGASTSPGQFADGLEHDFTGRELFGSDYLVYSTLRDTPSDVEHVFSVVYGESISIDGVRLIEGDHDTDGGWFVDVAVEVLVDGAWQIIAATPSVALDEAIPFQIIDLTFDNVIEVDGIRVRGMAGGTNHYINLAELDGLVAVPEPSTAVLLTLLGLTLARRQRRATSSKIPSDAW